MSSIFYQPPVSLPDSVENFLFDLFRSYYEAGFRDGRYDMAIEIGVRQLSGERPAAKKPAGKEQKAHRQNLS